MSTAKLRRFLDRLTHPAGTAAVTRDGDGSVVWAPVDLPEGTMWEAKKGGTAHLFRDCGSIAKRGVRPVAPGVKQTCAWCETRMNRLRRSLAREAAKR